MPCDINVIYTRLESTFNGLQFFADSLAVVDSQVYEISRNSERIRAYIRSRSSRVIDLGVNRKRKCDFLL